MSLPVRAATLALACLTALVALSVRQQNAIGVVLPSGSGAATEGSEPGDATSAEPVWGSYDPDTLYHARRVARAVRNAGWVSSHDTFLAHPHGEGSLGAAVPWPPFYDLLLTALARGRLPSVTALLPGASEEEADAPREADEPLLPATRVRIEQLVASVPMWCGALAALIAALAAAGLGRALAPVAAGPATACAAALVAGLSVAFTFGHVRYSHLGNGDHHAFVSMAHVAMLAVLGAGLRPDRIARPVGSAARGGLAGLLAGAMITSWTASILWVALAQLALVLRLALPFRGEQGRQSARGLPILATTFHKAALLVVMPAVVESPFSSTDPFSLIELSWFHLIWLAVGWLVFAPYALLPRFAAQRRVVATLPAVALALVLVIGTDAPRHLADAFSWAGASNAFMGGINESRPLLDAPSALLKFAGGAAVLLPVAWLLALRTLGAAPQLLPWLTVLPALLLFTLLQRRFAEGLVAPMAVLVAAVVAARLVPRIAAGTPRAAAVVGLALLSVAANPATVRNTLARRAADLPARPFVTSTPTALQQRSIAEVLEGLRPAGEQGGGVLAEWDLGHAIEWRAGRPTVASNFGLYLGAASFLAPWRFFSETDEAAARGMLEDLDVGVVLVDGRTRARRDELAAALGRQPLSDEAWAGTMAARLMGEDGATQHPAFLRMVAAGSPGGLRAFEVVRGARLRARGRSLTVTATLLDAAGGRSRWSASARAAGEGPADLELRVPYGVAPRPLDPLRAAATGAVSVERIDLVLDGQVVPAPITDWDVLDGLLIDVAR
ncbi:MAG: hypothetical protein PVJ89_03050 [Planctomycetota bacterium]|jgi:hypothetical protein